jgi:hypothetical protein
MSHRAMPKLGESTRPMQSLQFCNESNPTCYEFAQSSDPTESDTLKFKCAKHAKAARARGETGARAPIPVEYQPYSKIDTPSRDRRMAEIATDLSAGRIPGQSDATATQAVHPLPQSPPADPSASRPRTHRSHHAVSNPVLLVTEDGVTIRQFAGLQDAAAFLVVTESAVDKALRRHTRCGGHCVRWAIDAAAPWSPPAVGGRQYVRGVQELDDADDLIVAHEDMLSAAVSLNTSINEILNACRTGNPFGGRRLRFAPVVQRRLPPTGRTGRTTQPVVCLDDAAQFPDRISAGASVGVSGGSIYLAIKKGTRVGGKRWANAAASLPTPSTTVLEGDSMPTPRKVLCVETGKIYESSAAAAKATGVPKGTLGCALAPSGNGKAGGMTFRYAEESPPAPTASAKPSQSSIPTSPPRDIPTAGELSLAPMASAVKSLSFAEIFGAIAGQFCGRDVVVDDLEVTYQGPGVSTSVRIKHLSLTTRGGG